MKILYGCGRLVDLGLKPPRSKCVPENPSTSIMTDPVRWYRGRRFKVKRHPGKREERGESPVLREAKFAGGVWIGNVLRERTTGFKFPFLFG